jgi:hypothetical protein
MFVMPQTSYTRAVAFVQDFNTDSNLIDICINLCINLVIYTVQLNTLKCDLNDFFVNHIR